MLTLPVTLILIASASIGCVLLVHYVRGIRRPVLIGTHLLLGVTLFLSWLIRI